jgi:hypothetical protein
MLAHELTARAVRTATATHPRAWTTVHIAILGVSIVWLLENGLDFTPLLSAMKAGIEHVLQARSSG